MVGVTLRPKHLVCRPGFASAIGRPGDLQEADGFEEGPEQVEGCPGVVREDDVRADTALGLAGAEGRKISPELGVPAMGVRVRSSGAPRAPSIARSSRELPGSGQRCTNRR